MLKFNVLRFFVIVVLVEEFYVDYDGRGFGVEVRVIGYD